MFDRSTVLPRSFNRRRSSSKVGNVVEVFIAGGGNDTVNVGVVWLAEDSNAESSESGNVVRIYVGDVKGDFHLSNSTTIFV